MNERYSSLFRNPSTSESDVTRDAEHQVSGGGVFDGFTHFSPLVRPMAVLQILTRRWFWSIVRRLRGSAAPLMFNFAFPGSAQLASVHSDASVRNTA